MIEYFNNFLHNEKINEDGDLEEETLKKLQILKEYLIIYHSRDLQSLVKFAVFELKKFYEDELTKRVKITSIYSPSFKNKLILRNVKIPI